jgi:hypothetical protein
MPSDVIGLGSSLAFGFRACPHSANEAILIFFEKDGMRWVDYVMVCDCPCVPVCAESFEDRCHFLKRALKVYRRKYRNVKLAFYFKKKKPLLSWEPVQCTLQFASAAAP